MTNDIVRNYTTEELKNLEINGGDQTDWQRVHNMTDEEIRYDEDSPEITENMFSKATAPQGQKTEIKLSLDSETLEWYTTQKIAYQSLINILLLTFLHGCSQA